MLKSALRSSLTIAGIALVGLTPAAHAQVRSTVVRFGDLDISRPAGAQVLLNRIDTAADWACGTRPFILELKAQEVYLSCKGETMSDAVAEVDAPMLTALYERGGGRIGVVTVEPGSYSPDQEPYSYNQPDIRMNPIPNP